MKNIFKKSKAIMPVQEQKKPTTTEKILISEQTQKPAKVMNAGFITGIFIGMTFLSGTFLALKDRKLKNQLETLKHVSEDVINKLHEQINELKDPKNTNNTSTSDEINTSEDTPEKEIAKSETAEVSEEQRTVGDGISKDESKIDTNDYQDEDSVTYTHNTEECKDISQKEKPISNKSVPKSLEDEIIISAMISGFIGCDVSFIKHYIVRTVSTNVYSLISIDNCFMKIYEELCLKDPNDMFDINFDKIMKDNGFHIIDPPKSISKLHPDIDLDNKKWYVISIGARDPYTLITTADTLKSNDVCKILRDIKNALLLMNYEELCALAISTPMSRICQYLINHPDADDASSIITLKIKINNFYRHTRETMNLYSYPVLMYYESTSDYDECVSKNLTHEILKFYENCDRIMKTPVINNGHIQECISKFHFDIKRICTEPFYNIF